MKKLILFVFGLTVWTVQSQVEIRKPGETQEISGTTVTETITPDDIPNGFWDRTKFYVTNVTGTDQKFRIKRVKVNVPASGWTDEVCWPPNCFLANGDEYITPGGLSAPVITNGTYHTDQNGGVPAEIKPQYYPTQLGTSATYKYIVTDETGTIHHDSITVVINYVNSVGVTSITKNVELSMSPNPASDVVTISAEGIVDARIRVVDVLGNVVYTGEFSNSKKLNTTDFKNGVYFVTVQGDSNKGYTKKLVVRH